MANDILAFWTPGLMELLVIGVVFFLIFVIPIAALIVVLVVCVRKKSKQSLHAKVQELAEEVNKLKQDKQ